MSKVGYINYWGHDFIIIDKQECIYLIPRNNDNTVQEVREHLFDRDFIFDYEVNSHFKSKAYIERVQLQLPNIIVLYPKYSFQGICQNEYSYLEISGDVVDDFFNPAREIYKNPSYIDGYDYISKEISDKWEIDFEGSQITVELFYQNPFTFGLLGDQKIHPILRVRFPETQEFEYIYRVYSVIVRFLKLIRYDNGCGNLKVTLFLMQYGRPVAFGSLYDFTVISQPFNERYFGVNNIAFRQYIGKFLQFAANSSDFSFLHFPSENIRFFGKDFKFYDCISIFSAFESEYKANKNIYGKIDLEAAKSIREKVVGKIKELKKEPLNDEEKKYVEEACSSVYQIRTQFGQKQKIVNAYNSLESALENQVINIFLRERACFNTERWKAEINLITKKITELRNKYIHGDTTVTVNDNESEYIRFLEILTYSMLLKRMGFLDEEISNIVKTLFLLI